MYTSPHHSKHTIDKHASPTYYTEENDIATAMKEVCDANGWIFTEDLIADFNAWLPTADNYSITKYDSKTGTYIPKTRIETAKYWVQWNSVNTHKQNLQKRYIYAIMKHCKEHGFEYTPLLYEKFSLWKDDPNNKKLISHTYDGGYTYYLRPDYCVSVWFSTLKGASVL